MFGGIVSCVCHGHLIKHLARISTFQQNRLLTHCPCYTRPPSSSSSAAASLNSHLAFTNSFSINATSDTSSSTSSPYLFVQIRCTTLFADMLSEALLCFGASSTSIDQPLTSHPNDEVCLTSIYDISQDVHKSISHAADSIGMKAAPTYQVFRGYHSDWIQLIRESFHPVQVTQGLWIVPEWRTPPDLQSTNIILNPGLAFGTGDHPTTKLCLLLLHGLIKGGESFLDYGTGSGILAIAALKFGAAFSVGLDIDPSAITAARHNAALNNIGSEVLQLHLVPSANNHSLSNEITTGGGLKEGQSSISEACQTQKYDVVVANILLYPLLDLADQIISFAKPGAVVAVSGIIYEQVPQIIERYSEFLEDITVSKMDDWACVSGTNKMKD